MGSIDTEGSKKVVWPCKVCGGPRERRRRNYATGKLYLVCKTCRTRSQRACNNKHRRRYTLNQYGLSLEGYDRLFQTQGGLCAACGGLPDRKYLCVDHDHTTGKVRGLLCSACNVALGYLRDDPERIAKLKSYIEGS
jgi:hypothetical protein